LFRGAPAWFDDPVDLPESTLFELAQGVTRLRRHGSEWCGQCPFCGEDDGLWVNPARYVFHCFGCFATGSGASFAERLAGEARVRE
jgi:DNA primase